MPNTRQTFPLVNEWNFNNRYPPDTELLYAAGPTDDPDETTMRKIDVPEGADDTEDATVATNADSAADAKIVIHNDSATPNAERSPPALPTV